MGLTIFQQQTLEFLVEKEFCLFRCSGALGVDGEVLRTRPSSRKGNK